MNIPVNLIEVGKKPGFTNSQGEKVKQTLLDVGVNGVKRVKVIQVWLLYGGILFWRDLEMLANKLFADPITDQFRINRSLVRKSKNQKIVGVAYNLEVADPTEDTVKKAIKDLGIQGIIAVKNGQKYVLRGFIKDEELERVWRELRNPITQHIVEDWDKETILL